MDFAAGSGEVRSTKAPSDTPQGRSTLAGECDGEGRSESLTLNGFAHEIAGILLLIC